jgi:hypothetical protein
VRAAVRVKQGFRFGISFYLIAMLFILFDIETIFLYPIAAELRAYGSFALARRSRSWSCCSSRSSTSGGGERSNGDNPRDCWRPGELPRARS